MQEQHQLAIWNPERDCWEKGQATIFGRSDVYSETWPTSGMTRNGVAYALPTWAPPTSGSGCSSSPPEQMFRTPCAAEAAGGPRNPDRPGATMRLSDQVREEAERGVLLPTPVAQPSGNTPEDHLRKKPGRGVVTDLAIMAENGLIPTGGRLLPTPKAGDGEVHSGMTTGRPVEMSTHLPTIALLQAGHLDHRRAGDHTPSPSTGGSDYEDQPLPLPS